MSKLWYREYTANYQQAFSSQQTMSVGMSRNEQFTVVKT